MTSEKHDAGSESWFMLYQRRLVILHLNNNGRGGIPSGVIIESDLPQIVIDQWREQRVSVPDDEEEVEIVVTVGGALPPISHLAEFTDG